MMYNIATPKIWSQIFNIKSIDAVKNSIINIHNFIIEKGANPKIKNDHHKLYRYWCSDQHFLYHTINTWKNKDSDFILIPYNDDEHGLLCRNNKKYILDFSIDLQNKIKNGYYVDYHMLRPQSEFKKINWRIANFINQ